MEKLVEEVIDNVAVIEKEVRDENGCWYHMFVRPYWTDEKKSDGAVIALADINDLKRNEELLRDGRDYAASVVRCRARTSCSSRSGFASNASKPILLQNVSRLRRGDGE